MQTRHDCADGCCLVLNTIPRRRFFETLARWWWMELLLLLALPILLVILAVGISRQQVPQYESSTLLEIKAPGALLDPFQAQPAERALSPDFLLTQCELIKSTGCLQQVAENLDLAKRWDIADRGMLVKRIQRQLQVWVQPKTRLVRIMVHNPDAAEARDLAAEVARAYKEMRFAAEQRSEEQGLGELKKAVRTQEDTVEECRKVLSNIARAKGLVDEGHAGLLTLPSDPALDALRVQCATLKAQQATLEGQLKALEQNPFEQLLAYAKTATPPDAAVAGLYGSYLRAQQDLDSLKAATPADEAATQGQERRVAELLKSLESGVAILKATLRGELEIAKAKWAAAFEQERATADDRVKQALDRYDYVEAKQTFELESDQLQQMKRKLMEEEVRAKIPAEPFIVREEPVLATQPTIPNIHHHKKVAAVIGLLLALVLNIPMALLLEGCSGNRRFKRALRAMRAKPPTTAEAAKPNEKADAPA